MLTHLGIVGVAAGCGSDTNDPTSAASGGAVGSGGDPATSGGNPTGGGGAGATVTGGVETGGMGTGGAPPADFELQGTTWLYLGPWDRVHTLEIGATSVVYTDIAGEWSSSWTLATYDNDQHHLQLAFEAGSGTYSPEGQDLSASYVLSDTILTVQLAEGAASYPAVQSPGSCTLAGAERIPDCGIYMKQN